MTIDDIIDSLIDKGISLKVTEDGSLSVKIKNGKLDDVMRELISKNKKNLIKRLEMFKEDGEVIGYEGNRISLTNEIKLDEEISSTNLPVASKKEPSYIFLTGSTGFVGVYLLKELLVRTEAEIYCLVKAASFENALDRIKQKLIKYNLYDEIEFKRVIPIQGNLELPLFGLSTDEFGVLSEKIDVIYHNGAWVNHILPYSTLKKVNVNGTREVLKLATHKKLKAVNHISTLALRLDENFNRLIKVPQLGYLLSKTVAEQLVLSAYRRGVPITIYRLGMISGHSITGISNITDRVCQLLKGFIELGSMPDTEGLISLLPPTLAAVDDAVKNLIVLSKREDSIGKIFDINSPHLVKWEELLTILRDFGYDVEKVTIGDWWLKLSDMAKQSPYDLYDTLLALYSENVFKKYPVLISEHLSNPVPSEARINYNLVDGNVIKNYLNYFVSEGYSSFP